MVITNISTNLVPRAQGGPGGFTDLSFLRSQSQLLRNLLPLVYVYTCLGRGGEGVPNYIPWVLHSRSPQICDEGRNSCES